MIKKFIFTIGKDTIFFGLLQGDVYLGFFSYLCTLFARSMYALPCYKST